MKNDYMQRYQFSQMQKSVQGRNGKKIKLRWNTPTEVRRSLARINNMVANCELPAKEAEDNFIDALNASAEEVWEENTKNKDYELQK